MELREVKTRKEIRDFANFPLRLYKGNPYFVPCFYADELALFKDDYLYRDQADYVCYSVYDGKKIVGRIVGILQKVSNEKWKQKRVRFNRFDCIDDQEVADMLLGAVEDWARSLGMDEVVGPLGFSDMEREGLLIEGFDYLSTFEEQYNYSYYQRLIENHGYAKEVDWLERRLFLKGKPSDRLTRFSNLIMERNHLHFAAAKNTKDFLKKYGEKFFELCEKTYDPLYMTVPFSENIKKSLVKSFELIIDLRFVAMILDENENPICFGLVFPSIGKAIQKSGGRMTPATLIRLLRAIKKPRVLDFALIGVDPAYANRGVPAVLLGKTQEYLAMAGIEYAETNLNLETNQSVQNLWKNFDSIQHKRRRSFVRSLQEPGKEEAAE
ncbi:MAG: hypothetical protein PUJ43_06620 [Bacillales bacterium]|nr:hypothetical protein [Bacillales bacterium]MDY5920431.1 N-acetyltransferase [Candidatus Enteromonas sp.]